MDTLKIQYAIDPKLSIPLIKSGQESQFSSTSKEYVTMRERLQNNNIKVYSKFTEDLHYKFLNFSPVPNFIYAIGDTSLLDKKMFAIVGPRKHTSYSEQVLENVFIKLSKYDVVTISGMARGVDTLCHQFSIQNNIPTIAVLGGGLQYYMKSSKRYRIQQIIKFGGLVLSEFRPPMEPTRYSFPQRNRIIAGLADVVFLPEANEKSGSLITARYANTYNKPLYVVPNSIFSDTSKGTNTLLEEGKAIGITSSFSFLDKYFQIIGGEKNQTQFDISSLSTEEQKIYSYLQKKGEVDINTISSFSSLSAGELLPLLMTLELYGIIFESTPGVYSINH